MMDKDFIFLNLMILLVLGYVKMLKWKIKKMKLNFKVLLIFFTIKGFLIFYYFFND